jgi:hypothetical protein
MYEISYKWKKLGDTTIVLVILVRVVKFLVVKCRTIYWLFWTQKARSNVVYLVRVELFFWSRTLPNRPIVKSRIFGVELSQTWLSKLLKWSRVYGVVFLEQSWFFRAELPNRPIVIKKSYGNTAETKPFRTIHSTSCVLFLIGSLTFR